MDHQKPLSNIIYCYHPMQCNPIKRAHYAHYFLPACKFFRISLSGNKSVVAGR